MKRLLLSYEKCVGCEMCSMRCSLAKTGRVNPSQARIHLVREEERGVMMAAVCRHCHKPKCIPACPVDAIVKDEKTGLVSIDAALCIGCKKCVEACPYGSPVGVPRNERSGKQTATMKVICDLCGGSPACVEFCPTGALRFAEPDPADHNERRRGLEELAKLVAEQRH